ncbi:glycogen/starch/alpha-glucan phosphorylase [Flavihumibacter profundi]|uniref:glycogen/starch/alpha-glucan phosphorylase n=1 Tax=Flavihumibacter profundi TaxID=2716883 RepID=UPI001CC4D067|nr:glycogen/starch/alpha-glucan phosphorylase [Flavihumibacter profundi]MBZ5859371.1 glycogen/starch/alpha-glucan phosphorylase [Flavihumibacter profundi]
MITEPAIIVNQVAQLEKDILENLYSIQGKSRDLATTNDWYMAVAYTVRNRLMKNWIDTLHGLMDKEVKLVGYLSAEFLVGPHLGNALINLGIYDEVKEATQRLGLDLRQLMDIEEEPGLGNGGLGRLAACFIDSLTTLKVPAIGYGIRYEFGLFEQQIRDGWQFEVTDKWLRFGNPWEIARTELSFTVKIGGHTEHYTDEMGLYSARWIPEIEVKGVAYDTPVPGYQNNKVNFLRLWKSEAIESFDFEAFNRGDYSKAVDEKVYSENIGKVLYPNDEPLAGRRLRLSQQYFFVSCSIQDVLRLHELRGLPIDQLPDSMALQLNDTHPSIAVAELMRILIDEKQVDWDRAWRITKNTFAYTNHTLLPEALEKWPLSLFASLLPRHLEIIYEINSRSLAEVKSLYPGDDHIARSLSIIDEEGEKYVRMAHLACVGSHMVNGVSDLHADLLKKDVMRDFYNMTPEKFIGITNGVTPRRWLKLYSPGLSSLISDKIGEGWLTHMEDEIIKLEPLADDPAFQQKWQETKRTYKNELSIQVSRMSGVRIDPASMFDVMVKRIHEYKRQHLNVFHIIHLYNRIKKNPGLDIVPRTFIFGGKAAPGYHMAKLIIKLIHSVGEVVNNDGDVDGRLKVIFFPDFNVKSSEWVYRSADLSEQISTAGKEASGTGNMKFSMNGALTIGTMDGANIEIMDAAGKENFFLFGLTVEDIQALRKTGYRPFDLYQNDEDLREIIDRLQSGEFSRGDKHLFKPLVDSLLGNDPYFVLQDFHSYADCQQNISNAFLDRSHWTRMSILNVARMGKFSSDRSIREYCNKIWNVKPSY